MRYWADRGLNVLGVDIRGFGESARGLPEVSRWGYMLTGKESPETYILRGAVCDYVSAAQLGERLLREQTSRIVFHGISFAGGLALMAASLLQMPELLVLQIPTFGWSEGRYLFAKRGTASEISAYLERRPEEAEDLMMVLRYFDGVNFAEGVTCPTLMGAGLEDDVVPAHTVYAIRNHLSVRNEIMEFPVSHSTQPEEALWQAFEDRWLQFAVNGVPEHFGVQRTVSTVQATRRG